MRVYDLKRATPKMKYHHMIMVLDFRRSLLQGTTQDTGAAEPSHYWHIERKAKRGNRWIFVRDYQGTKREAAQLFNKFFRGRGYRLRHLLSYTHR